MIRFSALSPPVPNTNRQKNLQVSLQLGLPFATYKIATLYFLVRSPWYTVNNMVYIFVNGVIHHVSLTTLIPSEHTIVIYMFLHEHKQTLPY